MRSLWVGPKSRNMQVDLALMLRLEMAHSTCENAFFPECSLQLFVANPLSEYVL